MYGNQSRNRGIGCGTCATLAERYLAERSGSSKTASVVGSAKEASAFMKEGKRERERERDCRSFDTIRDRLFAVLFVKSTHLKCRYGELDIRKVCTRTTGEVFINYLRFTGLQTVTLTIYIVFLLVQIYFV